VHCSDIDLKLYGERGNYFVELLNSPLSRRSEPQRLELPSDLSSRISSVRTRIGNRQNNRLLGIALFDALLPAPINNIWHEARGRAGDEGILRLRLDIRAYELRNIPWELVHDQSDYLSLSTRTLVVRYLQNHPSRRPVESQRPLNVLLVTSTPGDLAHLAKVEQEIRTVKDALRNLKEAGQIGRLGLLEHATTGRLRAALSAENESYDVVHYMGHGSFRDDKGYLILEDDSGNSSWKEGESVGDLVRNSRVRLMFLNACDTGIAPSDESLIGVAHAAHAAGVPAVIAMQQTILDGAAAEFAGAFYQALVPNQSLEICLVAGREAIKDHLGPDSAEWAIPVMFANAPPGLLSSLWKDQLDIRQGTVAIPPSAVKPAIEKILPSSGTNTTGRSFISFTRTRAHEAELLIAALHDRGIPTWEKIKELDEEYSESAIRKTAADTLTSNALLWLTPDVKSDPMRQLETSLILDRGRDLDERDGFFAVPVLAGGIDATQVGTVLDRRFNYEDLRFWNVHKVDADPIGPVDAAKVASRVLNRRLAAIHHCLPEQEPLRMELFTRPTASFKPGLAFMLDWVDHFDGRLPKPGAWEQFLLPALKDIADAVQSNAPGRVLEVSGLAVIPVVTALGSVFMAPRGVRTVWRQAAAERDEQLWSLYTPLETSGFSARIIDRDIMARDLAVLVSVAANAEPAFEATLDNLPPFRGIVRIAKPGGNKHVLENAGQARDVAEVVIDGIRSARNRYGRVGCVHLFMSVPVGLAMMIGQLLNTLGLVQTYEYIAMDGQYSPALLLYPAG
jgi:hypothetical protein